MAGGGFRTRALERLLETATPLELEALGLADWGCPLCGKREREREKASEQGQPSRRG